MPFAQIPPAHASARNFDESVLPHLGDQGSVSQVRDLFHRRAVISIGDFMSPARASPSHTVDAVSQLHLQTLQYLSPRF